MAKAPESPGCLTDRICTADQGPRALPPLPGKEEELINSGVVSYQGVGTGLDQPTDPGSGEFPFQGIQNREKLYGITHGTHHDDEDGPGSPLREEALPQIPMGRD